MDHPHPDSEISSFLTNPNSANHIVMKTLGKSYDRSSSDEHMDILGIQDLDEMDDSISASQEMPLSLDTLYEPTEEDDTSPFQHYQQHRSGHINNRYAGKKGRKGTDQFGGQQSTRAKSEDDSAKSRRLMRGHTIDTVEDHRQELHREFNQQEDMWPGPNKEPKASSCVALLAASLEEETRKSLMGPIPPSNRLIEAIESLRDTIQDNTTIQSRHRTRGQRRVLNQFGGKGGVSLQARADDRLKVRKDKVAVEVRVVFLKIGEIDTLKELYHADVFIQAKWRENKLDSLSPEELSATDLDKYWNPLIYIDNILSETKEAQWLIAQANDNGEVTMIERRRIKGVFLETLELNDFPLDVQDLTVTLTTERPDTEIDLIPDQNEMSTINIQTFVDQQEWRLHEHVEITKRIMTQEYSSSMKSHPCLSVTCRAARRPGYFYWNVFLIMFMISGLSFATFAVEPEKAEYRLRLSFTLVLTSVTFKYVITQSLPKISYLTYMDKYVLMSLAILCIVSIWHALVTLIPDDKPSSTSNKTIAPTKQTAYLYNNPESEPSHFLQPDDTVDQKITLPNNGQSPPNAAILLDSGHKYVDIVERHVFYSFCVLYLLAHLIFIFWLYFDASKRRREMRDKDRDYKEFLLRNREWQINQKQREQQSHSRRMSSMLVHAI